MKAKITIHHPYDTAMLQDAEFISLLQFTYDATGNIIGIFIENTVVASDEPDFRVRLLEASKLQFCRIFEVQNQEVEIAYTDMPHLAWQLRWTNAPVGQHEIVSITQISA